MIKIRLSFSVEVVNKLVQEGIPFRDAYKQVGLEIEEGSFIPDKIFNILMGSIGNLCNAEITAYKNMLLGQFNFDDVNLAIDQLLA